MSDLWQHMETGLCVHFLVLFCYLQFKPQFTQRPLCYSLHHKYAPIIINESLYTASAGWWRAYNYLPRLDSDLVLTVASTQVFHRMNRFGLTSTFIEGFIGHASHSIANSINLGKRYFSVYYKALYSN